MAISWQNTEQHQVILAGKLSQSTVPSLFPIKKRMAQYNERLDIELGQLTHVDSAGLAFLIELREYCDNKSINLQLNGATPALTKLIALYNAEPLLKN